MYEFGPSVRQRGSDRLGGVAPSALGSNGSSREFCNNLSYEMLTSQHWDDCRPHITAAHMCQLSDGAPCSPEDIGAFCGVRSAAAQPPDCARYMAALDEPTPRTAADAPRPRTTRRQTPAGDRDIRELQTWLVSIGCPLPQHGVDGAWGSETAGAVTCAERQGHAATIAANHPWVSTMRVTPTGQPRPADFTFAPGATKKTPEQVVAAGNPGGAGGSVSNPGSTQDDLDADREQRAGSLGSLPPWGWALIAVGGVVLLGSAAFVLLSDEEER